MINYLISTFNPIQEPYLCCVLKVLNECHIMLLISTSLESANNCYLLLSTDWDQHWSENWCLLMPRFWSSGTRIWRSGLYFKKDFHSFHLLPVDKNGCPSWTWFGLRFLPDKVIPLHWPADLSSQMVGIALKSRFESRISFGIFNRGSTKTKVV